MAVTGSAASAGVVGFAGMTSAVMLVAGFAAPLGPLLGGLLLDAFSRSE